MTISSADYFGPRAQHAELTDALRANADRLLAKVNRLLDRAYQEGAYSADDDPDTGTQVSGSRGGSGDGGWRSSDSTTGAAGSKHRSAHAVDVFDPLGALDDWLTDELLTIYGLWREHPEATPTWCHLADLPPASGKRTFWP